MPLAQRAPGHGEILGKKIDPSPVNLPATGNNPFARVFNLLAGICQITLHECPYLYKTALVQKQIDPLSGGPFTLLMLLLNSFFAAARQRQPAPFL